MKYLALLAMLLAMPAYADDVDQQKEIARLKVTEFCAWVKPPPHNLIDAVNKAVQEDPRNWSSSVQWLNSLIERYIKNGCGNT